MKPSTTERLLRNIDNLRDDVQAHLLSNDELPDNLKKLKRYRHDKDKQQSLLEQMIEADNLTNSTSAHGLAVPSPSITDIPISDIFRLLQDVYKGKMNDYLQEILSDAEIEVDVVDQPHQKNNKKKEMDINIKLTATAIDRYAGLIKMALGTKNLDKNKEAIIANAYHHLESSNDRLQKVLKRIDLSTSINGLAQQLLVSHTESKSERCLSFFSFSNTSKYTKALINLLKDLSTEPLSADEMAGALYILKIQCGEISNKDKRDQIIDNIKNLLANNDYPSEFGPSICELPHLFTDRANHLNIQWPDPFEVYKAEESLDCAAGS